MRRIKPLCRLFFIYHILTSNLGKCNIVNVIDLGSNYSQYTTQNDGYLQVWNETGQKGAVSINSQFAIGGSEGYFAIYIKKGMNLVLGGNSTRITFCELG